MRNGPSEDGKGMEPPPARFSKGRTLSWFGFFLSAILIFGVPSFGTDFGGTQSPFEMGGSARLLGFGGAGGAVCRIAKVLRGGNSGNRE